MQSSCPRAVGALRLAPEQASVRPNGRPRSRPCGGRRLESQGSPGLAAEPARGLFYILTSSFTVCSEPVTFYFTTRFDRHRTYALLTFFIFLTSDRGGAHFL